MNVVVVVVLDYYVIDLLEIIYVYQIQFQKEVYHLMYFCRCEFVFCLVFVHFVY